MNDIVKIVQAIEDSNILLKGEEYVFGLPGPPFRLYPNPKRKTHFSQVAIRFLL